MLAATAMLIGGAISGGVSLIQGISQNANQRRIAAIQRRQGNEMGAYYDSQARQADIDSRGFGVSSYGKFLAEQSSHGIYSAREEQKYLSNVNMETGALATEAKQSYAGHLATQGLEGSVAGARGLAQIESERMGVITDAQEGLQSSEKAAMLDAKGKFALGETQREERYGQLEDRYKLAGIQARYAGELGGAQSQGLGSQALIGGIGDAAGAVGDIIGAGFAADDVSATLGDIDTQRLSKVEELKLERLKPEPNQTTILALEYEIDLLVKQGNDFINSLNS